MANFTIKMFILDLFLPSEAIEIILKEYIPVICVEGSEYIKMKHTNNPEIYFYMVDYAIRNTADSYLYPESFFRLWAKEEKFLNKEGELLGFINEAGAYFNIFNDVKFISYYMFTDVNELRFSGKDGSYDAKIIYTYPWKDGQEFNIDIDRQLFFPERIYVKITLSDRKPY